MRVSFFSIDDRPCPLPDGEVHLWTAVLDRPCDENHLIADERARAERFKIGRIRQQFVSSRVHLRCILSSYLGIEPTAVSLKREQSGKPFLDPVQGLNWHFNLSHSENVAVYAVARTGRVGIDVERWRDIPNMAGLVARFFTPREHDLFLALPEHARQAAFFTAWTRKEAALKAVGYGVQSLDRCDVTFCPGEPAHVLRMGDDNNASGRWHLQSFQPADNYVAAVAVELPNNAECGTRNAE